MTNFNYSYFNLRLTEQQIKSYFSKLTSENKKDSNFLRNLITNDKIDLNIKDINNNNKNKPKNISDETDNDSSEEEKEEGEDEDEIEEEKEEPVNNYYLRNKLKNVCYS